ncbi:hypothetical protein MNB_SV-6-384 [hydrothermal vent metagenome]|uniref:Uncharacterized protein n=1 Tax=hydrothermal vent metagenome TaxID=652676 RepID=A0A1W1C947_9ZZZZ
MFQNDKIKKVSTKRRAYNMEFEVKIEHLMRFVLDMLIV